MEQYFTAKIESLYYPEQMNPTLKDISIDFRPGEFVFLVGSPHSGKSSLCQALAGVIPSFKEGTLIGEINFEGENIINKRLPEMAGKIGLVRDESQNQLFCTTVEEDLAFGPCNLLLEPEEIRARIEKALRFVGLQGYEKRKPETLSGGEGQRVAIASMMTLEPKVIILDGAVSQLDPQGRKEIYEKLRILAIQEKTMVMIVEEKAHLYLHLAHRLICMDNGRIIYDGSPEKEAILSREKIWDFPKKIHPRNGSNPEGQIVSVNNLTFQYPNGEFALRDVSLDIYPREFVALMGKNGAGKTTLAKHLNGLHKPVQGDVLIHHMNTKNYSTAQLANQVGYLFQNPQVQICTNTVEAEVAFTLKAKKLPKREIGKRVLPLLDKMGLIGFAQDHPYRLGKSDIQKLGLASSLVNEPHLLVIDEPTSQMSTAQSWETMELIDQHHRKGGTVIMISHDLNLALHFASRIVVMDRGKIVLDIPTDDCFQYEERLCELGLDIREVYAEGDMRYEAIAGI
ncbi:energy-coupling factor transport system ATP-binding protein [Anaerosolibacter carboniphilus]|uniref:Energy-coupling factor transport system ATP-binding protein n=1 Tax=Anaerosolibacter carboniphilus TaxID=1417629 RepID=A0A841KYW1_9FIRM|nr:ABC transporter ATP-binding protein [Anaerosolibacter carboniphilus]MBB6216092.1 energy-coupling factor transport system ATP-binding protein [Anaerosolibacter carboniphilus]